MWRGDLGHAEAVYPLGPLPFVGTIAAVAYAAVELVTGPRLAGQPLAQDAYDGARDRSCRSGPQLDRQADLAWNVASGSTSPCQLIAATDCLCRSIRRPGTPANLLANRGRAGVPSALRRGVVVPGLRLWDHSYLFGSVGVMSSGFRHASDSELNRSGARRSQAARCH